MMRTQFPWTLLVLFLSVPLSRAADPTTPKAEANLPDPVRAKVDAAIQKVYPALVRIHVVTVYYMDGREFKTEGFGSGAIISQDGFVITNHHVAAKPKRIVVTLSDKEELDATLVGSDPLADIAVLKLNLEGRDPGRPPLPVAKFGNSDGLRVGDRVLAMGCPRALSQSVTMGIVSNRELTLPRMFGTFRLDGEEVGSLVKWIGHDAQIFPGNSGGPLVNLDGEIIGINDIGVGLGGAIPGNLAQDVAQQLIRYGEVKRSWLGLLMQPLLKSMKRETGGLVGGVVKGSAADKAGLKPGDIILRFNGKDVNIRYTEQMPEFNRLVLETPTGSTVEIVYLRAGKEHKTSVTLQPRGAAEGKQAEFQSWGLTVQELPMLAARELKREPFSGLLVTSVRPGYGASEAKPALQERDLLLEVGGKPVRTLQDLESLTRELVEGKNKAVPALVGFERKSQKLLTVVKIGERETPDRSPDASKAWLPVETQVLTPDLATALNLSNKKGVRITEVMPGSTAEKGGLKVGDILLRFDEEPIDASKPEDADVFATMVRRQRIGNKVKLDLVRAGKEMTIEVELAASPRSSREVAEYRNTLFEFRVRDLILQDKTQQELPPDQKGTLVTQVDTGGWAALARLRVNDILLAVDGNPVRTVKELRSEMQRIEKSKPTRVVFFVQRGVQTQYLELEPTWPGR